ncbi:hypothetical protein AJ79_07508 [Helicocarpus griseus UAMH5409]|uniref:Uncharacterized protein n=1 Tax=Helicocarpus griseus UAMH5409 TaxID=1447875 RepID=A0A2B7X2F8_9EURO|nr:hypothetical protein AJ79_07508 [Helicocarpus griseus UAMH5409]
MLALQSPKNSSNSHQENSSITPNILPCRIHHEGPVDVSTRYWNPVVDKGNPGMFKMTRSDPLNYTLQLHTSVAEGLGAGKYISQRDIKRVVEEKTVLKWWRETHKEQQSDSLKYLWTILGVLASQTDRKLELPISESASNQITGQDYAHGELDGDEDEADEGDREPETTILEKQGTFSEFVVWDHDRVPAADDPFVKGISEWIRFSEAVSFATSSFCCFLCLSFKSN